MKSNNIAINQWRVRYGEHGTSDDHGNNGHFVIPGPHRAKLFCIASNDGGWEHVSVSVMKKKRNPLWDEMCFIKDLFWESEEIVIQYHPAKSNYVNVYEYCLHLWKPLGVDIPMPPVNYV